MKFAHAVLGLGCALMLGTGSAMAHSPAGKAYTATVYSSFGTRFQDCFSFGRNGVLTILGFAPIPYRLDELNTQPDAWQAIGVPSGLFGLAFHGTVGGAGAQTISANGMNDMGDTFILRGVLDPSCAGDGARRRGGSPYRR